MKSRQLANVLFKVLGFAICLHAIPGFVAGIMIPLAQPPANVHSSSWDMTAMRIFAYAVGAGVQITVGIAVIGLSRKIATILFKDENE